MLISHDRELLDRCCNRTLFLRDKTLYDFALSFEPAKQALAARDQQAADHRAAEEKEIKRLQTSAKRLAQWGKTYDNEENLSVFTPDRRRRLLDCEFLHLAPGERVALLGRNGVGKSTTLNLLLDAFNAAEPVDADTFVIHRYRQPHADR